MVLRKCKKEKGDGMSRLIDADAFDERVRVAGGMSEDELTDDFKDGVQAVLYLLSNQPTITPEPHWIPVTERLPEVSGCYFVSVKNDHERRYSKTAWFKKGAWFARQDVLAWMPLPEPYKGVTT